MRIYWHIRCSRHWDRRTASMCYIQFAPSAVWLSNLDGAGASDVELIGSAEGTLTGKCWKDRNCWTFSCGSRGAISLRFLGVIGNWGRLPAPRTSDEATREGSTSDIGRRSSLRFASWSSGSSGMGCGFSRLGLTQSSTCSLCSLHCCFFHLA